MFHKIFFICLLIGMTFAETIVNTITARTGSEFSVIVDGNPTTGFTWKEASVPTNIISRVGGPSVISSSSPSPRMGAPSRFEYKYKADQAGQGELVLAYSRDFENKPPAIIREYHITVSDE